MTTIRLLVAHRHDSYAGEFAPEVLAVVDGLTLDENPEWWVEQVAREKEAQGEDVEAWAEVEIDLDHDDLMSALYPTPTVRSSAIRAVEEGS